MLINDKVYHFAEKNDICDEHSTFFFFIMVRSSPNRSYKRPNQSIHIDSLVDV